MMIDVPTTIMLLLAFTAGTIIALIIKKGKKKPEISQQIEILMAEKESLLSKLSSIDNESNIKVSEIKKQYELLLQEANLQYEKLDKQLKNALDGIIDDSIKKQLAEVEELKKKIKGLEEELEENEEDLSELKKRVKNKDNNIADLQNSLHKEQKESKLLNEELSSVRLELEEKAEELHLRTNSLVFLQEILSAKENTVEDIKTLYLQIDTFEAFIKGHFTELNAFLYEEDKSLEWNGIKGRKGFEEKRKFFIDTFDQWASTKRKSWLDGKTTIAFVGEFSAGKTSIINRILSQDNPNIPQLPVSTKATTAIPTYIAGGPTISYSFISGDGKRKTIAEETFKKVSKDILDQVKGVSALIKYFVMTYKNANLDGLSILNTPGFNSNDREDKERTIDVINECDALFWVFDVNAGTVNRSSISIIKEKLNKPLYIVINKVDTKSESEVQKVEELIKNTLTDEGLSIQQVIKFSSKAPLDKIMQPIKAVNKLKVRDTFVTDVADDLQKQLNSFDEKLKTVNNSYHQDKKEREELLDKLLDNINKLKDNCEEIKEMPRLKKHFWSSNRYEMSEEEGFFFKELLEKITEEDIKALVNHIGLCLEKVQDTQSEYQSLCNLKAIWQRINSCHEYYKQVSKYFSKL